jgi:cyclopropane fatty-acyl-phospholipid synthase-like methyltransferase
MMVVGIDVSVNQIQVGKLKLKDAHLHKQVEFVNCDIEQLPFRDGSFDAAVCMRLTGHVPQDLRVMMIRELARSVRRFVIVEYHDQTTAKGVWRALIALTGWKRFPWFPLGAPHALREMRDAGLHDFAIKRILARFAESYFVLGRKDERIQEERIMRVSE